MSKKILLVEDEALIAMNEAQMLKNHGYEVITVYSGEKAMEAVDSDPKISLILMDIDLGKGIDGTEAAEKILEKHDIPVVFLSSHTEQEVVEKTEGITSYGYIVKNSGETVILASIRMAFRLFDAHMKYKAEKERYEQLFTNISSGVAVYQTNENGDNFIFVDFNKTAEKIENISKEKVVGKKVTEVFPSVKDFGLFEVMQRVWQTGYPEDHFGSQYKDDRIVGWRNNYVYKLPTGEIVAVYDDVTEQKTTQRNLINNEEKYKALFNESPVANMLHDENTGEVVVANEVALESYGLKSVVELNNKDYCNPPYSLNDAIEWIHTAATEGLQRFEWKNKKASGEIFWEDVTLRPVVVNGIKRVLATTINITERKQIEKELKEQKELLQNITNNMTDLIALTDTDGTFKFVGNSHYIFGYDTNYFLGRNLLEYIHPEDINRIEASFSDWMQNNENQVKGESRFRCADGSYIWLETVGKKLLGEDGEIIELLWSNRDITERKQLEGQLKKNEERYKTIFYNSEVSLWEEDFSEVREIIDGLKEEGVSDFYRYFDDDPDVVWDLAKKINVIDINEATLRLYGAKTKKEMLGSLDKTLYLTEDTYSILRDEFVAIAEKRTTAKGEMKTKTLYGTVLDISMSLYISDVKDIMVVAINDITPYKGALKEKDFLMREINHRVKNSLNMVSSLISLKESEIEADLSNIRYQIEAIGLIHEKLYQTEHITEVCCEEYFDDLLNSIFSSFTARDVRIKKEVEDICVSTKVAMTLGLIINEIATNAVKYGFSDEEEAVFTIEMKKKKENNQHELTLSNSGNPFPEDINIESTGTLGLRLINALVAQIEGTIDLQKKPNPMFTISFPVGEE